MRLNSKIKKTLTALTTVALMAPLVASVTTGSVLADYSRPANGSIPIDSTIKRPVYENNPSDNNFSGTIFPDGNKDQTAQNNDSQLNQNKLGQLYEDIYLAGGALVSGSDAAKTINPTMKLNYTRTGFNAINSAITFSGTPTDTVRQLSSAQISSFLSELKNYNQDWNTKGSLNLLYSYSVNLPTIPTGSDVGGMPIYLLPWISGILVDGLSFNAYVRVPDGYSAKSIASAEAVQAGSKLSLLPKQVDSTLTNKDFPLEENVDNETASGKYKMLDIVDDHFLKYSLTSGTYLDFTKEFYTWLNTMFSNSYATVKAMVAVMRKNLPIQLSLKLDIDKMAELGDSYDATDGRSITSGKKLPAIDNMTTINATFLGAGNDATGKLNILKTGTTIPKDVLSLVDGTNSILYNKLPGQSMVAFPKLAYLDDTYKNGTNTDNKSNLIKGAVATDTTIQNATTGAYSLDEFNKDNMNPKGGNAFYTWDEYISPYDKTGTYNIQSKDTDNLNNPDTSVKNLAGTTPTNRVIEVPQNVDPTTINPSNFIRTKNYFTLKDSDSTNVRWAIDKDGVDSTSDPSTDTKDLTLSATPTATDPNNIKKVWYYGTDTDGNIMSPVMLTYKRAAYSVPTISTTSKVAKTDSDAAIVNDKLDVLTNDAVYQKDTFTMDKPGDLANGSTLKNQTVQLNLPSGVAFDDTYGAYVNGAKATVSGTGSTRTVTIPASAFLTSTTNTVSVKYKYKVTETTVGKQITVGNNDVLSGNLTSASGENLTTVNSAKSAGDVLTIVSYTAPKLSGATLIGTAANDISKTDVTATAGSTVYQKDTITVDDLGDLSKGYLLNNKVLNFKLPAGLTLKTDSVTVDGVVATATNNAGVYSVSVPDSVKLNADKKTVALSYAYSVDPSIAAGSSLQVGATTLSGDLYNGTTKLGPVTSTASNSATVNIIASQLSIDEVPGKMFFGDGSNANDNDPASGYLSLSDVKEYQGRLSVNKNSQNNFKLTISGYTTWTLTSMPLDNYYWPKDNSMVVKYNTPENQEHRALTGGSVIYDQNSNPTSKSADGKQLIFSNTGWWLAVNPYTNGILTFNNGSKNKWEFAQYTLTSGPNA